MSSSPGPEPFLPQNLMNLPSLVNFTIRALVLPPCPSATKMSPFGATRTADGALNSSGPLPATPALPSVINTRPSGLNLKTWWPFPSLPSPSVTQTLPSLSTCRPCGNSSSPAPNDFNRLHDESNLTIGGVPPSSPALAYPGFGAVFVVCSELRLRFARAVRKQSARMLALSARSRQFGDPPSPPPRPERNRCRRSSEASCKAR